MKPKILIFLKPFLPGYKAGGAIQAVKNLIDNLYIYYDFYVITNDRDYMDTKPYTNIKYGVWNDIYNAKIRYLSKKEDNFITYKKIIKELNFDLLYLQSFWCINFSLIPTILTLFYKKKIPILVHPRGQFISNAINSKSVKKKFYLFFYRLLGLNKKIFFQVTTEEEKKELLKIFPKYNINNISIASDMPMKINSFKPILIKNNCINLVFLARINRHKNLFLLLNILAKMSIKIKLDIYGIIEDKEEWNKCCEIINNLPENIKVFYCAAINHEVLVQNLKEYDMFCLFSKSENFSFSIYEALASGLPVIISDQTPWHKLKEYSAGWEIPINKPELIQEKILEYYNKTDEEKLEMKKGALQYAMDVSNDNKIFNDNKSMFDSLINKKRNNLC